MKLILKILVLVIPTFLLGQINMIKHTIDSTYDGATNVYAIDLDGDGDNDVLGSSSSAWNVSWWKNDGNENFTKYTIGDDLDINSFYPIDLDSDGDIDVVGVGYATWKVVWWKNDGNENFTRYTIDNNFNGARSVYACDLDGDSDMDVLGAAYIDDDIAWCENDGSEHFTKHLIDSTYDGATNVYAIDLDSDGDNDVLGSASIVPADISWWENDGSEHFTIKHFIAAYNWVSFIYAIDLDGDGDNDVLGSLAGNGIDWFENDGSGNFTRHTVDIGTSISSYAYDLDSDNDIDILSVGSDKIKWLENNGSDTLFINHIIDNFNGASDVYAIDLDGDGDNDVLGSASIADDITWWEVYTIITDVGTVSIDIPSDLPQDTTLVPTTTLANYGTETVTFTAFCKINPGSYNRTKTVSNLAPGDSVQITFQAFTFVSDCTVKVWTKLLGDENVINDTLKKVINVYPPGITEGGTPMSFSFGLENNPVKSKVIFNLALPQDALVTLKIYDITGCLVNTVSGRKAAGYYQIPWTSDVNAGVYFYTFESPGHKETGKLVIVH